YGTEQLQMEGDFEHQRFSLATFVGVNFAQLGRYFGGASGEADPRATRQPSSQTPFGNPSPGNSVSREPEADAKQSFGPARSQTEFGNEDALGNEDDRGQAGHERYHWVEPLGQAGGIFSRLLTRAPLHETSVCFLTRFGSGEALRLQEPLVRARQWLQVGRFELAAADYQEAIRLQPYNWVLLNEIATFLIFSQRDL